MTEIGLQEERLNGHATLQTDKLKQNARRFLLAHRSANSDAKWKKLADCLGRTRCSTPKRALSQDIGLGRFRVSG